MKVFFSTKFHLPPQKQSNSTHLFFPLMSRTGVAHLPLHGGKAPKWLFKRMVKLSQQIVQVLVYEYGKETFLKRLSDPFWFQALSCVLGYDWHSSGTTTVTCAALKQAIDPTEHGFAMMGGKGKTSRKTPDEIQKFGSEYNLSSSLIESLQYASRMAAKIDTAAVQDGYPLYHHVFFFTEEGSWGVIQQGMNEMNHYARRYHWYSKNMQSFTCEPNTNIASEIYEQSVLDMTSQYSTSAQQISLDLVNDNPYHMQHEWKKLSLESAQRTLDNWNEKMISSKPSTLTMPRTINWKKMKELYEFQPRNYEELLSFQGVGARSIRALALISDLIYGEPPSWKDPVKYSFTVGGKDGVPFPVDTKAMDESIMHLKETVKQAHIGEKQRLIALKRLQTLIPNTCNV